MVSLFDSGLTHCIFYVLIQSVTLPYNIVIIISLFCFKKHVIGKTMSISPTITVVWLHRDLQTMSISDIEMFHFTFSWFFAHGSKILYGVYIISGPPTLSPHYMRPTFPSIISNLVKTSTPSYEIQQNYTIPKKTSKSLIIKGGETQALIISHNI